MELERKREMSIWQRAAVILLSILLHVLLMLILPETVNRDLAQTVPTTPFLAESEQRERRISFELVETPEDIEEAAASTATDLVSDRSSRAKDKQENLDLAEGLPYSEGYVDAKNYPLTPEESTGGKEAAEEYLDEKGDSDRKQIDESGGEQFLAEITKKREEARKENISAEPAFDNRMSSSSDYGGFSFNTYNWNFAPYMLSMKRKIRSNMNLPYAFTHLGAISGDIKVHFTVLPTGEVNKMQVLNSNAHYSLEQSSVNAIRNSSAFDPLPTDFPEDKLEVTVKFSYSILKD